MFSKRSRPESKKIIKTFGKIFKQRGLNITVKYNLRITDFSDLNFNLRIEEYPYRKVKNELLYIHKQSNHPPSITKQIPAMISKRIYGVSCNEKCFDEAALE